ncbi:MAG: SMC-Scp complex subunit ScpB [Candidatus Raymondbacteria bacterium RifOxyA12_full_50_37]|nr:MAG: SMC-Scp complex subunit ScpB [Candidatus Raymondbacteria bacterium RifOxyA12_full_50_37]OGJ92446.1 MAG: SMC-Scp complex subunit ScpB [Candidatus Raymondbacteria bacterium RIFOXYA2_FULL_49_16]OGJ94489.1 MAG: SMC-Scp complex subunit ScpB [Candidatus Raymondbacteria bacterium RifOxyB12_full_50_8]OGJ95249.1 MAG: SMC-Scp complex subunit ScpB [Candidatus Raymondbacteria bacterium RIFOXYC2_FULL_50_21]OGK07355.1 MAG: SMC-Scp complex subunit ScpB [Candidatus Raymondbacteria bacterium RifOxyC12_f
MDDANIVNQNAFDEEQALAEQMAAETASQETAADETAPQETTAPDASLETELELTEADEAAEQEEAQARTASKDVPKNLPHVIEALLFASDEPLSASKLKDILNVSLDQRELRNVILDINKRLQTERHPFEIVEVAGGFQFRTISAYARHIKELFKDRAIRRLSQQGLETLAIIAYQQPASKSEVENIRSVSTDGALKTLLERRLIKILGRSETKAGKPIVYGTTREFLKYFGLKKISELPRLEELSETAAARSELMHGLKRDHETEETLAPVAAPAAPASQDADSAPVQPQSQEEAGAAPAQEESGQQPAQEGPTPPETA